MNKTKIILLSIGGASLVGTLVFGYLIYSAWSDKGEKDEEIGYLEEDAARLSGLDVYPSQEAVKATDANRKAYADWCELATAVASTGDMRFEATTPASFKSFINDEAKRYSEMPGKVSDRFVKADFGFGFDEYILKGALPAAADLPRLQREWYDVSTFVNILVDAKASSVAELSLIKETAAEESAAPARGKKKRQKKTEDEVKPEITRFNIVFTASPSSLVAVLNAIAANPRFIVAESVSFVRERDEIGEKLGEKSAKKREDSGRRRRRAAAEEVSAEPENEKLSGVVTDPVSAPDFKVTMRVAVYDFRTKSEPQEEKEESK